jgi:DNA-binding CsgD family transcriptional regulator
MLEIVGGLYDLCDRDAFPAHAMAAAQRLIDCELTSYNEINLSRDRAAYSVSPTHLSNAPDVQRSYRTHIAHHPLVVHYQRTRNGNPVRMSDIIGDTAFRQTPIYNEFFRLIGMGRQLAFSLPCAPGQVVGLAMDRSRRDFTERDRDLATLLRVHLIKAYDNALAVSRMVGGSDDDGENWGEADIVIDRDGRVTVVRNAAARLAARYLGERPRAGSVPEALGDWIEHQRRMLHDDRSVTEPLRPLVIRGEDGDLVVRLMTRPGGGYLASLEEAARRERSNLLSDRQHEVLDLVAEGRTDKEIALHLQLSVRTVQKHLERAYRSLGVTTRTAAIHELTRVG